MADEPNTEAEAGGKSKKKLIIFIVLGALLVGGAGAGAAFFLLGGSADEEQQVASAEPVRQDALYIKIRTLEGKPMFVVSLQSNDGKSHYMQAYVEAKTRQVDVEAALKKHMPLIVARLNNFFMQQSFDQLRTHDGRMALRTGATELVQEILQEKIGKPGIESILFTNFVMQ